MNKTVKDEKKTVPKGINRARGSMGEFRAIRDNGDGTFTAEGTGFLKGCIFTNLKIEDYYFFEFN